MEHLINAELSFLQKIVLLALDDKGWFGASEHKVKFGLVGAILFELYMKGRIRFENDEITVINAKSTEDVLLDRVLNLIKTGKKDRNLRSWIQRIVNTKLLLRKTVLKQLIQQRILGKEEYRLMVVLYQTKFPLLEPDLKTRVREQICAGIISGNQLEDYELMMLVVMNTSRMVKKNFGEFSQYEKIRERVNAITELKTPSNESEAVIKLLQTAISRAIIASNVGIHL